jgi:hypothetical protein
MVGLGPSSGSSSACQSNLSEPSRYQFSSTLLRGSGVLARRERGGMGPGIGARGRLRPG